MGLLSKSPMYRVEARRSFRINERFPVTWHFKDQAIDGTARVRNLSETGMMLETDVKVSFAQNSILAFEMPKQGPVDFLPPVGRMVWARPQRLGSRSLCGIEFVNPAQDIALRLKEKIQNRIARIEGAERIKTRIGVVLFAIMVALLAVYFIQQAIIHREIERSNHLMLANARGQASLYASALDQNRIQEDAIMYMSKDLNAAKALLVQTEDMLAKAQAQNASVVQGLNEKISDMRRKNDELGRQIAVLAEEMRILNGDIRSLDEGQYAISVNKNKNRHIRLRIRDLRREAHLAHIAAQEERDRIALLNGNQGYMIKDAKPFYSPSVRAVQGKVKIDIQLVE
ncbi:MAG: PilZ domain-containing protein [Candidatus Omnitrophota bacterium]